MQSGLQDLTQKLMTMLMFTLIKALSCNVLLLTRQGLPGQVAKASGHGPF